MPGASGRTLFQAVVWLVLAVAAAGPVGAAEPPEDVAGWRGAHWGVTVAELDALYGAELFRLPGRFLYGGAYAERALRDVELGGLRFTAYFQMNEASGRLQQVLLERRAAQVSPRDYEQLLDALLALYGQPGNTALRPRAGGTPLRMSLVWRFPTTTIHATFLDFQSTSVLFEDPNIDIDVLQPAIERRRIVRRFLPRRLLVRFHPSDREDLARPLSRGAQPAE